MNVVLFKVGSLGDSIVYVSIVQTLARQCPELKLHLCASSFAADFFSDWLPPEQMLVHDRNTFQGSWRHPLKLLGFLRHVSRWHAEASMLGDEQGNVSYFLAKLAGGRIRIGPERPFVKIPGALTKRIPLKAGQLIPIWNWEIAREFTRAVAGKELPERPPLPELKGCAPLPLEKREGVIIHPGGSAAYQRWDVAGFREVAVRLSRDHKVTWYDQEWMTGVELPASIQRLAPGSPRALYESLCRARLLLANNSGPMHVASMAGCPGVIPVGPSNFAWDPLWHRERFLMLRAPDVPCIPCDPPEGPIRHCTNTQTPMACMKAWTPEAIYRNCVDWMERRL